MFLEQLTILWVFLAASFAACLLTPRLFEFLHINIEAFSSDTYVAIDLRKHECFEIYFS